MWLNYEHVNGTYLLNKIMFTVYKTRKSYFIFMLF